MTACLLLSDAAPTIKLCKRLVFWSYVHKDDEADSGRIRRLALSVQKEYSLLTGRDLELFMDHDIKWGEEWRARIDQALAATTFLIPVVTPRYFESAECRRELLTFTGHAKSLGRLELLLPLYYADVRGLADGAESDDEAIALVSSTQRVDWRRLRLEDEGSPAYRKQVNVLAVRLREITNKLDSDEAGVRSQPDSLPESDEDGPGFLEVWAVTERAWPELNNTMEALNLEIRRVGDIARGWTPKLNRAAERGVGPTLLVAGELAKRLDGPAAQMDGLSKQFAAQLLDVDAGVLALIRVAEGNEQPEDHAEFFGSVHGMKRAADEGFSALAELADTLEQTSQFSTELRRPLRLIRDGLRRVVDAKGIIDEWARRVTQIRSDDAAEAA